VAHVPPRDAAQFLMDEGQQLIERRPLTPTPSLQQSGRFVGTTGNAPILHPPCTESSRRLAHRFAAIFEGFVRYQRPSRLRE
jgi:hypothetical protein